MTPLTPRPLGESTPDEPISDLHDYLTDGVYDPKEFWHDTGRAYWRTGIAPSSEHVRQEALLRTILREIEFQSVLDVGCGGGRLGRLIHDVNPDVQYTGIDISDQALMVARSYLPDAELEQTTLSAFKTRGRHWDLVLTCEVLLHIPPEDIEFAVSKLRKMGDQVLAVEWIIRGEAPPEIAPWNWPHDYEALGLGQPIAYTGEQGIFLCATSS